MASGCSQPLHCDDRCLDLLRRVPPGRRELLQHGTPLRIGIALDGIAVPRRHDDEQPVAVHKRELEPEELRVLLWLAEKREGRAEIGRAEDHRDPDPEMLLVRFAQDTVEAFHRAAVDLRREREEDVLCQEVVAGRVAVRPRRRRRTETHGHYDEGRQPPLNQTCQLPEG